MRSVRILSEGTHRGLGRLLSLWLPTAATIILLPALFGCGTPITPSPSIINGPVTSMTATDATTTTASVTTTTVAVTTTTVAVTTTTTSASLTLDEAIQVRRLYGRISLLLDPSWTINDDMSVQLLHGEWSKVDHRRLDDVVMTAKIIAEEAGQEKPASPRLDALVSIYAFSASSCYDQLFYLRQMVDAKNLGQVVGAVAAVKNSIEQSADSFDYWAGYLPDFQMPDFPSARDQLTAAEKSYMRELSATGYAAASPKAAIYKSLASVDKLSGLTPQLRKQLQALKSISTEWRYGSSPSERFDEVADAWDRFLRYSGQVADLLLNAKDVRQVSASRVRAFLDLASSDDDFVFQTVEPLFDSEGTTTTLSAI
jgi:hypothetical protein